MWRQLGAAAVSEFEREREAPGFAEGTGLFLFRRKELVFLWGLRISMLYGSRGLLIRPVSGPRSGRQMAGQCVPVSMPLAYARWCLQALKVSFSDEGGALMLDTAFAEPGNFDQKRGGQAALVASITLDRHDPKKHAED